MTIFAVLSWSNFVGTDHELSLCDANIRRWLARVIGPTWPVDEANLVVLAGPRFTADALLGQLEVFAKLAKKGDWITSIGAHHGTDEYPLYNESGVLVGRQQAIVTDDFDFDKPGMVTASTIERAIAGCEANVAMFLDCCTCGQFIRDTVDAGLRGMGWKQEHPNRYLPNPAWAGKRAFRDLPVVTMCPAGERIVVVTACAEGESAPDIDEGGFSDLATAFIQANPAIATGEIIADHVGHVLDPAIGNNPQASGPIADTPICQEAKP